MFFSQETLKKYPSLKKYEEQGDDIVESHDGRESQLHAYIQQHPSSASSLQNNPPAILQAMDTFAAERDFLINIGPHKGQLLADVIRRQKPSVVVEMGGYVGYSAILMADAMRRAQVASSEEEEESGSSNSSSSRQQGGGRQHPLELWSLEFSAEFAGIARDTVSLAGLSEIVRVEGGTTAADAMRRLVREGKLKAGGVDVLFIDHIEDLYTEDFKVAWSELGLLRKGSVVVADNVLTPGAPEYREFVRELAGLGRVRNEVLKGKIVPGDMEDEMDVTTIL